MDNNDAKAESFEKVRDIMERFNRCDIDEIDAIREVEEVIDDYDVNYNR